MSTSLISFPDPDGSEEQSTSRAESIRPPSGDDGMTTAEYAVGTIAAVAFAAVLYKIIQSPEVHAALARIVTSALNISL